MGFDIVTAMTMRIGIYIVGCLVGGGLLCEKVLTADWPQLQCNPQRTGYTSEKLKPPFKVAWYHNFQPERVSRDVQAVVYSGKVFVPTKSGNLYALGAADGKEIWKFKVGAPILHTAACGDGKVVVAALNGVVYAVNAETGTLAWKFKGQEGFGFSTSPLIAEGMIFIGQRGGMFYGLNLRDGRLRWKFKAEAPIFNTAAFDAGKVFFCDEALYVHCLDARTGKEIWRSEKLYGQSAKQYHPVVYKGLVMLRPMMTHPSREYYDSNWGKDPAKRLDYIFQPTWAHFDYWYGKTRESKAQDVQNAYAHWFTDIVAEVKAGRMPKVLMEAQEFVVQHYREKPYDQDFFVLDEATGKQAFIPPHFAIHSLPGPVCPPVADGSGCVIIPWVFINHGWGRLNLEKQRIIEIIIPPRPTNADETLNVSVGGNLLFIMHCEEGNANYTGIFDLERKKFYDLPPVPNRWGQLTDNCESGGNAASIANGFFYHIVFHQLAAWTSAEGEQQ